VISIGSCALTAIQDIHQLDSMSNWGWLGLSQGLSVRSQHVYTSSTAYKTENVTLVLSQIGPAELRSGMVIMHAGQHVIHKDSDSHQAPENLFMMSTPGLVHRAASLGPVR
jgi:hypothetical protein